MAFTNNVMIVRRILLARLVKMWKDGKLIEDIDRLPIDLSPKNSKVKGRCCVHKERAVWRYKSFPLLGYDMEDEKDELTPLSYHARKALSRKKRSKDNILCVVDEACSTCVQINYEITSMCRGCVARTCFMNCPKNAIEFKSSGKAKIDHDKCISCGICQVNCPFHAIVYIPIPCEESCPVKAISKDEFGIEHIDESKCIYCGKCINACPFGAIFEISQAFDVLELIKSQQEVIAIVAPSILSQYDVPVEQVYGALKQVGFSEIVEVAQGAMQTTENEAQELQEKLENGQSFMTTSCCPSYVSLVEKHIPELAPYVSTTGSPMYYTARIVRDKYPNAKIVFIGPCVAKRAEARKDECVDFAMTFEELDSIFMGFDIDMETTPAHAIAFKSDKASHGYAAAGGVLGAVKKYLKAPDLNGVQLSNLHRKNIALLKSYGKTGKCPNQFIEVMACEGGCISGPSIHNDIRTAAKIFNKELSKKVDD